MPVVSYIVPLYQQGAYLGNMVASLQEQRFRDWEAVIVDDGSTDGSGETAERLAAKEPRLRVIHQANGGVAAARNTGIAAAVAGHLVFLDADDTVDPGHAEVLLDALGRGGDVAVAHVALTDEALRRFPGEASKPRRFEVVAGDRLMAAVPLRRLAFQGVGAPHSAMFRRAAFGGLSFQPGIPGNEDWLVFWQCAARGCRFVPVGAVVGNYRIHAASITRNAPRQYDSRERAICEHMGAPADAVAGAALTVTRRWAWELVGKVEGREAPVTAAAAIKSLGILRSDKVTEPYAALCFAGYLNRLRRAGHAPEEGFRCALGCLVKFPSAPLVMIRRLWERLALGQS